MRPGVGPTGATIPLFGKCLINEILEHAPTRDYIPAVRVYLHVDAREGYARVSYLGCDAVARTLFPRLEVCADTT